MNKLLELQRKLNEESIKLRQLALYSENYEETKKYREQQEIVYKKWLFLKKLNNCSKKGTK